MNTSVLDHSMGWIFMMQTEYNIYYQYQRTLINTGEAKVFHRTIGVVQKSNRQKELHQLALFNVKYQTEQETLVSIQFRVTTTDQGI